MGIYEKAGIRKIAIYNVELITWIRTYGLKDGWSLFSDLSKAKEPFFKIKTSFFKNDVWLRNNYSDQAIFRQVFYEKQYELKHIVPIQPKKIIDAGANVGFASLYFSYIFPDTEIVAVEPEPNNFHLLEKNTTAYNNIICKHAAIWYKEEKVNISNPDSLAASFMVEKTNENAIQGITIDSILAERNWDQVDIVKMDIEGAEKEVFSGNNSWLHKTKLLIIELHDRYKPDCTKTFFKALENIDYEAYFQHENIFILFKENQ
jgi:FkbM family methyltransferase